MCISLHELQLPVHRTCMVQRHYLCSSNRVGSEGKCGRFVKRIFFHFNGIRANLGPDKKLFCKR